MAIIPKLIIDLMKRFIIDLIGKSPMSHLPNLEKSNTKIHLEPQRTTNNKSNLRTKNTSGGIIAPKLKLYYRTIL